MARNKYGKTRTIPHRRKREGRTDYKRRLALLKSGLVRLVIRKSLNRVTAQIVEYSPDGDKILVSATSTELGKLGWKAHKANIPSSYLTGLLLGAKAKKSKIGKSVLDIGLQTPIHGGRLYAALKGAVDAGLDINCSEEAFPSDERVSGKHIVDYANKIKGDSDKYGKQFSKYAKDGVKPEEISKLFDDVKKKILA